MPRKSLTDEAFDAAAEVVGDERGYGAERLAYESAYETVVRRVRQGRYRGLGSRWERDFLEAVVDMATRRLKANAKANAETDAQAKKEEERA